MSLRRTFVLEPTCSPPLTKDGGEQRRRRNPRLRWFELIDVVDAVPHGGNWAGAGKEHTIWCVGDASRTFSVSTFKAVWGGPVAGEDGAPRSEHERLSACRTSSW